MKRILLFLLIVIMTFGLTGAMAAEKSVKDSSAFESRLGIHFAAETVAGTDCSQSIVDDSIGQVVYRLTNVNGEQVRWIIRFEKEENFSTLKKLSGIGDSLSAPLDLGTVGVRLSLVQSTKADIYTWSTGDARFCLIIEGVYSNNQFSAQMDRIMEACGL